METEKSRTEPTREGPDSDDEMGTHQRRGSESGNESDSSTSNSSSDSSSTDESSGDTSEEEDDDDTPESNRRIPFKKMKLRFRNYKPFAPEMEAMVMPPPEILEDMTWIDNEIRSIVERAQQGDDFLLNLEPKRITWDLERDLAPKLEILNARTQKALVDLVREKIRQEGGSR